jgi:hypothetical protein
MNELPPSPYKTDTDRWYIKRELLVGCGSRRTKIVFTEDMGEDFQNLTTLDLFDTHNPDVIHDLEVLPYPFEDDSFDEIHAYEVLEHTGKQGDWRFFFAQFAEFYRILKPNGYLAGTSPYFATNWAWGDPGHTRIISNECFVFLDQTEYIKQVGKTPMTDYRGVWKGDFERMACVVDKGGTLLYLLKAHKPARGA